VSHKKTCHFVFDYNSGISWSIFILFVPVETGRNTLQSGLQNLPLHPNCVSTVPGKTKTAYKQQILMPIITVSSIGWVVHNFSRKSSNVNLFSILGRKFFYQSSVRKTFTFLQAFDNFLRPIFKFNVFHFEK